MKKIIPCAIAVTAICALTGCETTGLSPRETSGVSYPNYVLSLPSSGTNTLTKISTPIRLALVQVGETAPPDSMIDKLAAQKTLVVSVMGLPLPGDAGNFPIYTRASAQGPDYAGRVKAICNAARTTGADYVFLFGGSMDSWQENNSLSVFDLTIVGGFLVPDVKIHIEGKGAGTLISTTTYQPIFFVDASVTSVDSSPDFLADGKTMTLRAKDRDELANKLSDQFLNKLAGVSVPTNTTNN
jgi:hypothetical protein